MSCSELKSVGVASELRCAAIHLAIGQVASTNKALGPNFGAGARTEINSLLFVHYVPGACILYI